MKQILALFVACLSMVFSLAQAQVSIGSLTPAPDAQLDVVATDKGILIPRVTSTASVTASSEGLLVYQTSAPAGFYVRKAGSWVRLATTEDTPGTIIQYASGSPISMYADPLGSPTDGTVALIGFGNSASEVNIDDVLSGNPLLPNFAGLLPRSGILTSISANFVSLTTSSDPMVIRVRLFFGDVTSNKFYPNPWAEVPIYFEGMSPGKIGFKVVDNLNIALAAQTRLLLVFSCELLNSYIPVTVLGYASAGINIK